MRLSLYSQLIKNGEDHELVFDNGTDNGRIFDVRTGGTLSLPVDFNGILRMIALRQGGCMVYVIKPLFSRVGDYRALAIFVPRKVLMTALADLPTIVGAAADVLAKGGDTAELSGWFSRDYQELDFEWNVPRNDNNYAFRIYGKGEKYSADDLLGPALLQPEYAQYEGVFLLDRTQAPLARTEKMADLTNHLLGTPALVAPPKKKALANNGKIYHRGTDRAFEKPVLSRVGDRLPLELRKDNCAPFAFDFLVHKNRCEATLPADIRWRRIISGVTVSLVDEEGNPIVNDSKHVDVRDSEMVKIAGKDCRVMPESELTQAHFIVKCDGYQNKDEVVDLTKGKKVTIVLQKALTRMSYSVNGTPRNTRVKFDIDWPELDADRSPLPGYRVNSRRGHQVTLERDKTDVQKKGFVSKVAGAPRGGRTAKKSSKPKISRKFFYALGIGLVLGLLLGWMAGAWMKERAMNKKAEEETAMRIKAEKQRADSLRQAELVGYIDNTEKWVKAEADSLFDGALAGIFDALNEYDFDTFDAKTDSLHLTGSKQWKALKEAVDRAKKPDVLNTLKTTRSPYSKDGSITLEKYISVLDQTAGYIPEKGAAETVQQPETKDEKK